MYSLLKVGVLAPSTEALDVLCQTGGMISRSLSKSERERAFRHGQNQVKLAAAWPDLLAVRSRYISGFLCTTNHAHSTLFLAVFVRFCESCYSKHLSTLGAWFSLMQPYHWCAMLIRVVSVTCLVIKLYVLSQYMSSLNSTFELVGLSSLDQLAHLRTGSHYGQTSRGEAFGPMKTQKCPKFVLSAFILEAEVQRTSPPKEPRWQHF